MNMTVASFRCFVENENIQQNGVLRFTLYHVFQKTLHQSLVLVCTELFSLTFAIVGQLRKAIPNQTSAGYRVSVLKDGARQQRNATSKESLFISFRSFGQTILSVQQVQRHSYDDSLTTP